MDQSLPIRLPVEFERAAQRLRMAARAAAEQTVDSLGLATLSTHGSVQRDALLGAQFALNRGLAVFALTFNEALDTDMARQVGVLERTTSPLARTCPSPDQLVANWETLSLVEDQEVEVQLAADRFAREIGQACEWELRELDAYVASLLHLGAPRPERNPLRAETLGQALIRAVEQVSQEPDTRKVLCTEIGHSLARTVQPAYAQIINEMRDAGIKPVGLSLRRNAEGAARPDAAGARADAAQPARALRDRGFGDSTLGTASSWSTSASGLNSTSSADGFGLGAGGLGRVDSRLMAVLRELSAPRAPGSAQAADRYLMQPQRPGLAAANLIVAHREELRQAATSALDQHVIDVVAELFDEILSDPKVAPQIARLIARLQLPVLRAALGDQRFFTRRKHPVRSFVNRIASLGCAVDDLESAEGRALLERLEALVQDVATGDFERLALYEQNLAALHELAQAQARERLQALGGNARLLAAGGADQLLERKEAELRVQQQFARDLERALCGFELPDYLRGFLANTWSRVIASAAQDGDAALATQLRDTGRALLLSVQPKGSAALRQAFIQQLPRMMKELNVGLDRIGWPDAERRAFFAQLLPAHADSLKCKPLTALEQNLLSKQADGALATPLPATVPAEEGRKVAPERLLRNAPAAAGLNRADAEAVGLVDERAVDWSTQVDIDLGGGAELGAVDISLDGLPPAEDPEPSRGKALVDHLQIGFAYRMHLNGQWQKVRLTHMSSGRSFFIFSHGAKQQQAVTMTYRMLSRLCESGRLATFENAYLIERATARARRQLATLLPPRAAMH